jgi:hypothetical protein
MLSPRTAAVPRVGDCLRALFSFASAARNPALWILAAELLRPSQRPLSRRLTTPFFSLGSRFWHLVFPLGVDGFGRGAHPLHNGLRLSCGALKNDSFLNLRAPSASGAC